MLGELWPGRLPAETHLLHGVCQRAREGGGQPALLPAPRQTRTPPRVQGNTLPRTLGTRTLVSGEKEGWEINYKMITHQVNYHPLLVVPLGLRHVEEEEGSGKYNEDVRDKS